MKAASTGLPFGRVSCEMGVMVPLATGEAPRRTVGEGVGLDAGLSVIGGGSVGTGATVSENIAVRVTSAVGITKGVGEVVPGSVHAKIAPISTKNARRLWFLLCFGFGGG